MRDIAYTVHRRINRNMNTVSILFPACPALTVNELEGLITRLRGIQQEMLEVKNQEAKRAA